MNNTLRYLGLVNLITKGCKQDKTFEETKFEIHEANNSECRM